MWWIYPSDAGFVGGLVIVAVDAAWGATRGRLTGWRSSVTSFVIYASYVTSNVVLLHAMHARSAVHVKAFIAGLINVRCAQMLCNFTI